MSAVPSDVAGVDPAHRGMRGPQPGHGRDNSENHGRERRTCVAELPLTAAVSNPSRDRVRSERAGPARSSQFVVIERLLVITLAALAGRQY